MSFLKTYLEQHGWIVENETSEHLLFAQSWDPDLTIIVEEEDDLPVASIELKESC